ncbi:MAG: CBASS cGAMP-activated phospholipase [Phycisphaerales bacterium]
MPTGYSLSMDSVSLGGVRVWLSGSVPEVGSSSESERADILDFVRDFSRQVFRLGGHIIHGSHPSFTPTLLEQASAYQASGGKKDSLTLAVSRFWSKDASQVPVDEWRKKCLVYETPEASGPNARDDSLEILRKWMAARCDVIVVVGGKWWREVADRAGVPIEVGLAMERGIACFLLGGLGGVARDYVATHAEMLGKLKNGLDHKTNASLATAINVGYLADTLCHQIGRLPLVRGRGADGVSFRILALDGGGIKGTFTASVLATWEKLAGLKIVDHFDLIAGTSTGGILAIGLGLGLSASEMLAFYRQRGPVIFPVTSMARKLTYSVRHVFRPKFSQAILLRELEDGYYGGKKPVLLKESKSRLLIPAYHAVAGSSHVFRTPHHNLLTGDADTEAAHAALATAAAPTYFSAAKVGNMIAESSFFDGGVWANSPAMAAIVEATCFLNVPLDRIDVLSVGTTESPFSVRRKTHAGIARWGKKFVDLLMAVQAESSLKYARLLAGEPRFLRVNVMTTPGSYSLDRPSEIEELASLGNTEASKPEVFGQVKSRFLNGVMVAPWERFS